MKPNNTPAGQSRLILGLTGTIAAGKSTAARYLTSAYGFWHIDADQVGHRVVNEMAGELSKEFGDRILDANGKVIRKELSCLVFTDPEKLARLNALTHPRVCKEISRMISEDQRHGRVLIEAVELLRTGLKDMVREVWVVMADPQVRTERMMQKRGLSRQQAEERIRSQLPDEFYRQHASVILQNSLGSPENLYRQIDREMERLCPEERA